MPVTLVLGLFSSMWCGFSCRNLVQATYGFEFDLEHRIEINRRTTRVGTFEVCVSTHVSLRMFIMQVLASQLPSLANRNAELAVPPLFWPVNCIKIGGHVTLLSGTTVYSL